ALVSKSAQWTRSAAQASSAALVKGVRVTRTVSQATTATLATLKVKLLTLTASISSSALVIKSATHAFSVSVATALSFAKIAGVGGDPDFSPVQVPGFDPQSGGVRDDGETHCLDARGSRGPGAGHQQSDRQDGSRDSGPASVVGRLDPAGRYSEA